MRLSFLSLSPNVIWTIISYPTSQKKVKASLTIFLKKVVRPGISSKSCITLEYNPERLPEMGVALKKSIHPRFLNKKTNRTLQSAVSVSFILYFNKIF